MARREFEMSEADLETILDASKPTSGIMAGGYLSASPQENANLAWATLGRKMGFKSMTVKPVAGRGDKVFTAEPDAEADDA